MCNNGFGGCSWIIILILILSFLPFRGNRQLQQQLGADTMIICILRLPNNFGKMPRKPRARRFLGAPFLFHDKRQMD